MVWECVIHVDNPGSIPSPPPPSEHLDLPIAYIKNSILYIYYLYISIERLDSLYTN